MENIVNDKRSVFVICLKILLVCGIVAGEIFLWCVGAIFIGLGSVNPVSMNIFWTLLLLSLFVLAVSFLFRKAGKIWKGAFFFRLVLSACSYVYPRIPVVYCGAFQTDE